MVLFYWQEDKRVHTFPKGIYLFLHIWENLYFFLSLSLSLYIYIYIYIYKVEMIDCGESESMIEICRRLDKSNTSFQFRKHDISFCLIYPTFHIFLSYIYIYIYIYIYKAMKCICYSIDSSQVQDTWHISSQGLTSLFNGISTFIGYLMLKPSL